MAERVEYKVTWRRLGQARKRKIYQTRRGAEDFMRFALMSPDEVDPDDCEWLAQDPDGEQFKRMTAPFVEEPRLDFREVGEWQPLASQLNEAAEEVEGLGD